ncbi:hypothetical protein Shyhy01_24780 [Streptomyces hygroscopicus subsp. hygroscopicus]|nr:hypothetical protein [Streptomyces hygroscopicus]GLX49528.1 hypothetical protein Shyhy01_24780 [Streptomyces hygroscopicus subsp. hygroscopicus]
MSAERGKNVCTLLCQEVDAEPGRPDFGDLLVATLATDTDTDTDTRFEPTGQGVGHGGYGCAAVSSALSG